MSDQVLYHHGILGQKWGSRNGPPYPLSASQHRAVVKRAKRRSAESMSDSELQAAVNRKRLEQQYVDQAKRRRSSSTMPIMDDIESKAANKARGNAKDKYGKKSQQVKSINEVDNAYHKLRKVMDKPTTKKLKKHAETLSDEELRKRTRRLQLENDYDTLNPTKAKERMDAAREFVEMTGSLIAVGTMAYKNRASIAKGAKYVAAHIANPGAAMLYHITKLR